MKREAQKMTPVAAALPFVVALGLAAGCEQDSPVAGGDLTTKIDTVDGVVRVTNHGTPPEWQLTPVVSIGPRSLAASPGGPEEFGRVSSAALGPNGDIFVADGGNAEIRVFGLDGAHRLTFGRSGEGPGEFRGLYSVAWVGDRLLALDYHLGRITEFSADGEPLGQRRMPGRISGSPANLRFYQVGAGKAYAFTFVVSETRRSSRFVGHDSRGATGDTLLYLTSPTPASIVCEHSGGYISAFDIPYAPKLVQHPGSGGALYTARTGAYRIAVTRGGGDTLRVIERTLPAEPVSDEEWETGNQEFREFIADTPDAACDPARPSRPTAKPFIEEIFVAPDGRLWVEVNRTAGNRWELFDTEGRLLASLPVHARKERAAPAFGPEHLINIRQDNLDLDHVDVYRIDRGSRPVTGC